MSKNLDNYFPITAVVVGDVIQAWNGIGQTVVVVEIEHGQGTDGEWTYANLATLGWRRFLSTDTVPLVSH